MIVLALQSTLFMLCRKRNGCLPLLPCLGKWKAVKTGRCVGAFPGLIPPTLKIFGPDSWEWYKVLQEMEGC